MHFVCLLSALYLPLFAISTGVSAGTGTDTYWTADVVAGLVVLFQAIFGTRFVLVALGGGFIILFACVPLLLTHDAHVPSYKSDWLENYFTENGRPIWRRLG
jgi:hypothetical protein